MNLVVVSQRVIFMIFLDPLLAVDQQQNQRATVITGIQCFMFDWIETEHRSVNCAQHRVSLPQRYLQQLIVWYY